MTLQDFVASCITNGWVVAQTSNGGLSIIASCQINETLATSKAIVTKKDFNGELSPLYDSLKRQFDETFLREAARINA